MADLNDTVTAAREGCRDAFDDLVRATYRDTYSHALRLVGNADDAHDVAQDTYLKAFRHLPGFRGDASVGTWLYRITANCAHNLIDRRRRTVADALPDGGPDEPVDDRVEHDPVARVEAADLRERLVAALAGLPTKLRTVIVLRDIYDLSHDAIAKQLDISETAAKVRLHRARQKLREQLFDGSRAPEATEHGVDSERALEPERASTHALVRDIA